MLILPLTHSNFIPLTDFKFCEIELVILSSLNAKCGNQERKSEGKTFHLDNVYFVSGNILFFMHNHSRRILDKIERFTHVKYKKYVGVFLQNTEGVE